jgi:hypothetical protein
MLEALAGWVTPWRFVITSRLSAAKKSMEPVTLKLLNELYRELNETCEAL